MSSRRLLLLPLAFPMITGCGDSPSGSFCDAIKPGLWRAKYTLRANSDSSCNQVPDRTIVFGGDGPNWGLSCDPGCTCTNESNDVECTLETEDVCANSENACSFAFTTTTAGRALCELWAGSVHCVVDITLAWEAEAP